MKKLFLTILLGLVLILAACGSDTDEAEAADGNGGGDDDVIKVGYIGALSGGSSSMGVPGRNGIQLAVDEINENGGIAGKQVELVATDDKADPAQSATQAQRLINRDEVVAIFGGPNSGTVKANNEVIAQFGVPQIISIAQADDLIVEGTEAYKTTFSMTENNAYDIRAIGAFLESEGHQDIAIIADDTAYGQNGTDSIERILTEMGMNIVATVDHPVGVNDLTAQTLRLRDADPDAVYVFSLGPEGALFMKTLRQLDWEVPVVGGRGLNMKAFVDLAEDAADGIVLPSVINQEKPEAQEFMEKYDEVYGDDPTFVYSSLGYDAMYLLKAALEETGGEGGEALVEALENIDDHPTVTGSSDHRASLSNDKRYAPNENYVIFNIVEDGEFKFYTEDVDSGWE